MGRELDAKLRARLNRLGDGDRLEKALERAYAKLGMDKETFEARFAELPSGMIPIKLVPDTEVVLVLRTGVKPLQCNGLWSAETGDVTFATTLDADHILAPLAYAGWVVPDRKWQIAHLGRAAVDGEDLAKVTMWEWSLDPAERKAWRRALDDLAPAKALGTQLTMIRVTARETDEPEKGAKMILEALGLAKEED